MARRTKLTPEIIRTLDELLSIGNTDKVACAAAGISTSSFYSWLKQGEDALRGQYVDFLDMVTRARAKALETAVAAVHSGMVGGKTVEEYTELITETRTGKDGKPYKFETQKTTRRVISHAPDYKAGIEYLKRRDPEHWSEKINHEQHVTIEHIYESAADEFERLIGRHAEAGAEASVAGKAD